MDNKKYSEYTQEKADELWSMREDYEYDEVVKYINTEIDTFPKRLLRFYNKNTNQELSASEAKDDLLRKAEEKGIDLNGNTIKNWFTDTSPKMDETARKNLFKIAFILNLEIDNVEKLFNSVLLNRAFNLRNYQEFIYLFCLWNEKSFSTAESIIATAQARIGESGKADDDTVLTEQIKDIVWGADEETLLKYIEEHKHNFSLSNVTGARIFEEKWAEITGTAEIKGLAHRESELEEYIEYDESRKPVSIFANQCRYSSDFALRMILGQFSPIQPKEKKAFQKQFRKEIVNQFPDKQSISKTDSAYVLRKNLILAYFYWYWIKAKLGRVDSVSFDGFTDELDGVLEESGLSMLYPGNPYDALFLYSAYTHQTGNDPLSVFRELINVKSDDMKWWLEIT